MIRFFLGGGGMNFFNTKMSFLYSEDTGVFYTWSLSEKKSYQTIALLGHLVINFRMKMQ